MYKKADVIVYDRLANKNYLKEAKENCEFIYVGKASSNHTLPQDDINRVIADKAKEGKIVTRLKGGDPLCIWQRWRRRRTFKRRRYRV